jgi:hypothetical protein
MVRLKDCAVGDRVWWWRQLGSLERTRICATILQVNSHTVDSRTDDGDVLRCYPSIFEGKVDWEEARTE